MSSIPSLMNPIEKNQPNDLQRLQAEYVQLDRLYKQTKSELVELQNRKPDQKSHSINTAKITLERNKYSDVANRLRELVVFTLSHLPQQAQQTVKEQLDNIQRVAASYDEESHRLERPDSALDQMIIQSTKSLEISASSPESNAKDEYDEEEEDEDTNESMQKKPRTDNVENRVDGASSATRELESDNGDKRRTPKRSSSRGPVSSSPIPSLINPNAGIPKSARLLTTLPHNDIVCAVKFNSSSNRIYSCSKGLIKIWDLKGIPTKPIAELRCLDDNYIRACEISLNDKFLVVGGESNSIVVWDLEGAPVPTIKFNRIQTSSSCYSLKKGLYDSPFSGMFFSGHHDGTVTSWDYLSGKSIRTFTGHGSVVTSIDISPDGSKLISAGLDSVVKVWDIMSGKEISSYQFPSPIYSAAICPGESWLAVGLENSHVEVTNLMNAECKYQLHLHENSVLDIKFSNNSKWFISCGKDKFLNSWRSPFGGSIFQCKEPNSILCCDISPDDNFIVTGSGDKVAAVYEVIY